MFSLIQRSVQFTIHKLVFPIIFGTLLFGAIGVMAFGILSLLGHSEAADKVLIGAALPALMVGAVAFTVQIALGICLVIGFDRPLRFFEDSPQH